MESKYFIIDSSVIISAYDSRDPLHDRAINLIDKITEKVFYLHPYVIQEVVTVLTYKFGPEYAKVFLENISKAEDIVVTMVDLKKEIKYFYDLDRKISFTDSTLIKLSKEKNIPILTFDKQIISILNSLNF